MAKLDAKDRDALDKGQYAFPKAQKEPIEDADHVRAAMARFNQVQGVSDLDRDEAWIRIQAAAKRFGVEIHEKTWRELGNQRG